MGPSEDGKLAQEPTQTQGLGGALVLSADYVVAKASASEDFVCEREIRQSSYPSINQKIGLIVHELLCSGPV